jgi:hypothetical protein
VIDALPDRDWVAVLAYLLNFLSARRRLLHHPFHNHKYSSTLSLTLLHLLHLQRHSLVAFYATNSHSRHLISTHALLHLFVLSSVSTDSSSTCPTAAAVMAAPAEAAAAVDTPTGTTIDQADTAATTMTTAANNMQRMGMRISPRYRHQWRGFGSPSHLAISFSSSSTCSASAATTLLDLVRRASGHVLPAIT